MGQCGLLGVSLVLSHLPYRQAKQGDLPSRPATQSSVVDLDGLVARWGAVQVCSRVSPCRRLERDYRLDNNRVLGSGMNGPVVLATGVADGRKYAVKSFSKVGATPEVLAALRNEVEIYLSVDHPHVARLENVYETEDSVHLVMELMDGGELYDRLTAATRFTEDIAADVARQMLLATAYLHERGIAHRDMKLENFMFQHEDSNHLKLIDFGLAAFCKPGAKLTQSCGSVHYVAPEVLANSYTTTADMWSIGVIVCMLISGSPPFFGSEDEVMQKVMDGKPHYNAHFYTLSKNAQAFVKRLLVRDPRRRLTVSHALRHPWIRSLELPGPGETAIDGSILRSIRSFGHASHFRRAVLSMMAWSLSADDRAPLQEQFLLMDRQHRGSITLEQFSRILEETCDIDRTEALEVSHCLNRDCSGEIKYSEFLAAALLGSADISDDLLRKTYARFDRTDCGRVSSHDLRVALAGTTNVEEIILEAGTSGSNTADFDAFCQCFNKAATDATSAVRSDAAAAAFGGSSVAPALCGGSAAAAFGASRLEMLSNLSVAASLGSFVGLLGRLPVDCTDASIKAKEVPQPAPSTMQPPILRKDDRVSFLLHTCTPIA